MKPTQSEIDEMIKMLNKYNNAKSWKEGTEALSGIISIAQTKLDSTPPATDERKE